MKKIFLLLPGLAFALAAGAQQRAPKTPKKKPVTRAAARNTEKAPLKEAFRPDMQHQLDQTRYFLYNPGTKPGC